ncbi:MAG: asparagine synthase (glutamine-hydrolyzing) [Blastocatellia bacterium]|jgi:asparagine synthase (glutamine-hydrolysing)|nr:asparagine synthase (glutamine-hydrolyzing) [Blastocatellia bacterium]
MCGINGIALSSRSARRLDARLLERMRDVITHRGPDDAGIFMDGPVGLGHRRLSIVDVAAGHQPMTNEDETLHIVFNGEIYNHADFRPQLEARGHRYRTHCDTETILHLYEEEGARAVESLRGMFAFAIWDAKRRELFIARDRLGVKPLYYAHTDDGSLYFASEIKSLLEARAVAPEVNYRALPDYLANHATSGEETLFRGIRRLLPGHTLRWRDGEVRIEKYWDVRFDNQQADAAARSDEDYINEWTELFRDSVRLRLMADVPLGMFLSGGIDSSAIAAVMSKMVSEPIKTFSVAFKEREANELEYARLVARAFKTDHHEIIVSPEDFFKVLPQLVWHEDEPLAHPSSVALYFVSRLASEHVKVVLTGEGSDELLAGYDRYRKTVYNLSLGARYHGWTNDALRSIVRRGVDGLPRKSKVRQKLSRTFLCLTPDIESIYFDNFAVFSRAAQRELLTGAAKEIIGSLNPYADVSGYLERTDARTLLDRLLYADTKTYLHELLMKQDQMSMAASIESRVPFLDHKLVEFTAALPARMKLRGWTTKYILRRSMKDVLPPSILKRRKMGFPVPIGAWFRGRYASVLDEYVLGERAAARGLFDAAFVRSLVERHRAGIENHSERLWSLVNFEIWQRRFIDGEAAPAAEPSLIEAVPALT